MLVLVLRIVKGKLQIKYLLSSAFNSIKLNNVISGFNNIFTKKNDVWRDLKHLKEFSICHFNACNM